MANADDIQSLMGMLGGNKAPEILSMTPEMAQMADQNSIRDRGVQLAQLQPGRATVAGAYNAGAGMSNDIGGMLGIQSPMVKMAQQANAFKGMINQMDQGNAPSVTPIDSSGTLNQSDAATLAGHYQRMALFAKDAALKSGMPPAVSDYYYKQYMQQAKDVLTNNKTTSEAKSAAWKANNPGFADVDPTKLTPQSAAALQASTHGGTTAPNYRTIENDPDQVGSAPERMNKTVADYDYRVAHGLPVSDKEKQLAENYRTYLTQVMPSQGHGIYTKAPESVATPAPITNNSNPYSTNPTHPAPGVRFEPGTAPGEQLNKDVAEFGQKYTASGMPEFKSALTSVNQMVAKYADDIKQGKQIPGFSPAEQALVAHGQLKLLTPEARHNVETFQRLMNKNIKMDDGSQVTASEMSRTLTGAGMGSFLPSSDILHSLAGLNREFNARHSSFINSAPETVRQRYFGSQQPQQQQDAPTSRARGQLIKGSNGFVYVPGK